MKKIYNLFGILLFIVILVGCNSSKRTGGAYHHRSVNNTGYVGY